MVRSITSELDDWVNAEAVDHLLPAKIVSISGIVCLVFLTSLALAPVLGLVVAPEQLVRCWRRLAQEELLAQAPQQQIVSRCSTGK